MHSEEVWEDHSIANRTSSMHVRLIGGSKLTQEVSMSMDYCLSLCGPVMDWQPLQGEPRLSPNDSWDRLQTPCDPDLD